MGEFMKSWNRAWGLFPIFACAFAIFTAEAGDAVKGKDLFERRCIACHGASGDGNKAIAEMFQVNMRPLSSKEVQEQEDAVLKKIVLEGRGKMKPVGVSEAEADDVVAFLRSLKK